MLALTLAPVVTAMVHQISGRLGSMLHQQRLRPCPGPDFVGSGGQRQRKTC